MSRENILKKLNEALNREISTALRYVLQVSLIKGAEWESARELYQSEIVDELGHAQYLANKIVMLGGVPNLEPDLNPPPKDPREMLKNDIEQERIDVQNYRELAQLAEDSDLIELKLQMEEQAADEARHAENMTRLLG